MGMLRQIEGVTWQCEDAWDGAPDRQHDTDHWLQLKYPDQLLSASKTITTAIHSFDKHTALDISNVLGTCLLA
jgi:hypothetical protein